MKAFLFPSITLSVFHWIRPKAPVFLSAYICGLEWEVRVNP